MLIEDHDTGLKVSEIPRAQRRAIGAHNDVWIEFGGGPWFSLSAAQWRALCYQIRAADYRLLEVRG